MHYRDN